MLSLRHGYPDLRVAEKSAQAYAEVSVTLRPASILTTSWQGERCLFQDFDWKRGQTEP